MKRGRMPAAQISAVDLALAATLSVQYREKFGLSQLQMAAKLGTYPYIICNIERQLNARPTRVVAALLALAQPVLADKSASVYI